MKKIFYIFIVIFMLAFSACTDDNVINILSNDISIQIGEVYNLDYDTTEELSEKEIWSISNNNISINSEGYVTGLKPGETTVWVYVGNYSDSITVTVVDDNYDFKLSVKKTTLNIDESTQLLVETTEEIRNITYSIVSGDEFAYISNDSLVAVAPGIVEVVCYNGDTPSNIITIEIVPNSELVLSIFVDQYYLNVDEYATLSYQFNIDDCLIEYEIISGNEYGIITNNTLSATSEGEIVVVGRYQDIYSEPITIYVISGDNTPDEVIVRIDKDYLEIGDSSILSFETIPSDANKKISYEIIDGSENATMAGNVITVIDDGPILLVGIIDSVISNVISINTIDILDDPYINVVKSDFYANYYEATSYQDSYYRSLHGLMSGSIADQDQAPTLANRPMEQGLYLRNTSSLFSLDSNTYYILDDNGNVVDEIYRGGAYVSLEEVAAYVLAFGNVPANYLEKKNAKPSSNEWGKYLRLNHTAFSGDTNRYPYEPVLPRISGCGGDLYYYEIDMGTTGTDCDPNYDIKPYNDGKTITRGAARIVYTRYDANKDEIIDINEKYVFYTYNHYNDFQEYLNYKGGWGEMFGNITGGGTLSSKKDYNPTEYIKTILRNFITF